jgi:hypothetical protein
MTAVEWLIRIISDERDTTIDNKIIQQAKEMEKQQIVEAHGAKYQLIIGSSALCEYWIRY